MIQIGVARLWHEANAFSPIRAERANFEAREWVRGSEAAAHYRGTQTEIGGVLAWAEDRNDVKLTFSRCASALPSGPISQVLLDALLQEIAHDPTFENVDAIYLSLHGASLGTEDLAPETTLLRRLRKRFADLPIVASFDMHACLTEEIASLLDGATVYRKYPHIDMAHAGSDAISLAYQMARTGKRGHVAVARIGHILPSFNMRTDGDGPMAEVAAYAAALSHREDGGMRHVYPFAAFACADAPQADSGAIATGNDPRWATNASEEIADALKTRLERFRPTLPDAETALDVALSSVSQRVAVLEPSDNPFSGGMGDTPGLLQAAVSRALPEGSVFAFICDPGVVGWAHDAGIGASFRGRLAGRITDAFGPPIPLDAEVKTLTHGRFQNTDTMERGLTVHLGRTVVLCAGPLSIIVTEQSTAPNDSAYFALHGIDLRNTPLLLCKAKNHFMAAFGEVFDAILPCDTPGPAMANVKALPYRHIPPERLAWLKNGTFIGTGKKS